MTHWLCGGKWELVKRKGRVKLYRCSSCGERKIKLPR